MNQIPSPVLEGSTYTFKGRADLEDRQRSPYLLLPFDVPDGISELCVRYEYSDEVNAAQVNTPGNVLDIGLFSPEGAEFGTSKGFRGWSGSMRHSFYVGSREATPGYLPGPIIPGTWHVVLGLYRLLPQGCSYTVAVEMRRGTSKGPKGDSASYSQTLLVFDNRARWYKGDLHAHTHHSDGTGSVLDLALAAQERGLDFLAVTEHNTVSHLPYLPECAATSGVSLIPGEEITTYWGHANVWGIDRWYDFRCWTSEQMQQIIDDARASGAIFSINHPKDGGPPWEGFQGIVGFHSVEVWQAYWFVSNYQSLAFWDALLRQGLRVTGVGGSDCHQWRPDEEPGPVPVGTPTTWVYASECSTPAILEGIRAGHVFISSSPEGPQLYLTCRRGKDSIMMGDELCTSPEEVVEISARVRGAEGLLLRLISAAGPLAEVPISGDDFAHGLEIKPVGHKYVRAEVIAPPEADLDATPEALWVEALSNPIYFRITS